jgi:GH43 family beta-xylosidase
MQMFDSSITFTVKIWKTQSSTPYKERIWASSMHMIGGIKLWESI